MVNVICNQCGVFKGGQPMTFYLFECGHVFCQRCQEDGKCTKCLTGNRFMIIDDDVQAQYFSPTTQFGTLSQAIHLQERQFEQLGSLYAAAVNQNDAYTNELEAYRKQVQEFDQRLTRMEAELENARRLLRASEDENRRLVMEDRLRGTSTRDIERREEVRSQGSNTQEERPSSTLTRVVNVRPNPFIQRQPLPTPVRTTSSTSITSTVARELLKCNLDDRRQRGTGVDNIRRGRENFAPIGNGSDSFAQNSIIRPTPRPNMRFGRVTTDLRVNPGAAITEMLRVPANRRVDPSQRRIDPPQQRRPSQRSWLNGGNSGPRN